MKTHEEKHNDWEKFLTFQVVPVVGILALMGILFYLYFNYCH